MSSNFITPAKSTHTASLGAKRVNEPLAPSRVSYRPVALSARLEDRNVVAPGHQRGIRGPRGGRPRDAPPPPPPPRGGTGTSAAVAGAATAARAAGAAPPQPVVAAIIVPATVAAAEGVRQPAHGEPSGRVGSEGARIGGGGRYTRGTLGGEAGGREEP
ncbi:hypothetical protein I4F81_006878 [Pyropia yezoensis]|uniref:Uncharacterized protein n=1 Tax=Pyropia yezoensis TaxID=2788 RepID=A0ACC3C2B3_PYRYE|nr:hypothetical protein I4F81_006878 [Neopyropia yezoensis]